MQATPKQPFDDAGQSSVIRGCSGRLKPDGFHQKKVVVIDIDDLKGARDRIDIERATACNESDVSLLPRTRARLQGNHD